MTVQTYEPVQETLHPVGSITELMDELVRLEKSVHEDLRVYRWQPNVAQLPALWNWIATSPFEQRDLTRWRDHLNIVAYVGVAHSDNEMEMARLEEYADAFRNVVDQALYMGRSTDGLRGPLNGKATWAERQNMAGPMPIDMNGVPVLAFQFGFLFRLDRRISPTGQ